MICIVLWVWNYLYWDMRFWSYRTALSHIPIGHKLRVWYGNRSVNVGLEGDGRWDIKVHTRWWQVWERPVAFHVPLLHLLLFEEIEFSQYLVLFFLQFLLLLVELLSCSSLCKEVWFVDIRLRKMMSVCKKRVDFELSHTGVTEGCILLNVAN